MSELEEIMRQLKKTSRTLVFPLFCFFLITIFIQSPVHAAAQGDGSDNKESAELAGSSSESRINETLAGLSDERVRQMLIEELKKDALEKEAASSQQGMGPGAILGNLLRSLSNKADDSEDQLKRLWAGISNVFPDLYKVFINLCPYGTSHGAIINILWVFFFISIGFIVEFIFKKYFISKYFTISTESSLPQMNAVDKTVACFAGVLPDLLGLFFFFGAAYFSYFYFIWTDSPSVQLFFLAFLIVISIIRTVSIISHIIFSPSIESFRIIPVKSHTANLMHKVMVWTTGYIVTVLMFAIVTYKLGAEQITVLLLQLFLATLLLIFAAGLIIFYKKPIQSYIIADASLSWSKKTFASIWHILAMVYLFVLWLLLVNDMADQASRSKGAFILSLFIVPIWMVADLVIQWVIRYAMSTLKIHLISYEDTGEISEEELERREKGRNLFIKVKGLARIGVILALLVWIAGLWNIRIPFFSSFAAVLLDTMIIMTIALTFWKFMNSWIERKLQDSSPEDEIEGDDEWGGAASRGRSYTLLPMVRKFIGTIIFVMVIMTVISSMGVNIGPLLAGAGVIGLAIGFGAQKLVSDVFSGFFYLIDFFYLMDDAFRVGEYISAGNVSGSVESITLRNVMLRHHRGMLQIIPHSDLGAITNYMRGGIVVKFNMDFPYDAPIDKIRKIFKKVGKQMLENEEYGKDFIKPLKSQGVRQITNSVMTIRAKFTAQPGTHFVIRREAYRLITEALSAQGIHYAHRKVIVDVSENSEKDGSEGETAKSDEHRKRHAQAAGAAAMRVIEEEEAAQNPQKK